MMSENKEGYLVSEFIILRTLGDSGQYLVPKGTIFYLEDVAYRDDKAIVVFMTCHFHVSPLHEELRTIRSSLYKDLKESGQLNDDEQLFVFVRETSEEMDGEGEGERRDDEMLIECRIRLPAQVIIERGAIMTSLHKLLTTGRNNDYNLKLFYDLDQLGIIATNKPIKLVIDENEVIIYKETKFTFHPFDLKDEILYLEASKDTTLNYKELKDYYIAITPFIFNESEEDGPSTVSVTLIGPRGLPPALEIANYLKVQLQSYLNPTDFIAVFIGEEKHVYTSNVTVSADPHNPQPQDPINNPLVELLVSIDSRGRLQRELTPFTVQEELQQYPLLANYYIMPPPTSDIRR